VRTRRLGERILVDRLREIADLQDRELAEPRIEAARVADELAEPVGARAARLTG
jgi:hypothetical protein